MKIERKLVNVSAEQIKAIVRGELFISDIPAILTMVEVTDDDDIESEIFYRYSSEYYMTFEDFYVMLKNMRDNKVNPKIFYDKWFRDFEYDIGDNAHFPQLWGFDESVPTENLISEYSSDDYISTEEAVFFDIFVYLECTNYHALKGRYEEFYQEAINRIENFYSNQNLERKYWKLTDTQKHNFVCSYYSDEQRLRNAPVEVKVSYRQYLDEWCESGNLEAIEMKGYSTYGEGNPVYECDWENSRDCMLKLVEKADGKTAAQAANTLGYIYYYGRCNGGRPQYDEAFRYFTVGAAFGYYESQYKIADMMIKGKFVPKNIEAATRLYERVYDENYYKFEMGEYDNKFADLALRMANVAYEYEENYMKAYKYVLQAWLAIRLRSGNNWYGDSSVSKGIKRLLDELREKLGNKVNKSYEEFGIYQVINKMLHNCNKISLCLMTKDNKQYLKVKRLGEYNYLYPQLITIPSMSFCQHIYSAIFEITGEIPIKLLNQNKEMIVDECQYYKLLYKGKVVGKIRNKMLRFYYPLAEENLHD